MKIAYWIIWTEIRIKKDAIIGIGKLVHLNDQNGPELFGEVAIRDKTSLHLQALKQNAMYDLYDAFFTSLRIINLFILRSKNL